MIIPYSTDAPIYHLPIATGSMIGLNVLVFMVTAQLDEDQVEQYVLPLILQHGTFNPIQWVTSNFLHGGFFHVLGNMFGLWSFGILVEGKVGWVRFLAIFFGIGVTQCAVEQTMMLLADGGGSFGASAIVYGLLATSLIWAPQNEMSCVIIVGWRILVTDLTVLTLAEITIGIEVVVSVIAGLTIGSQVLHLMGVALGLTVGIVMLKRKWVDCENWDLFSVWKGTHYKTISERDEDVREELHRDQRQAEAEQKQRQLTESEQRKEHGLAEIRRLTSQGDPGGAFVVHVQLANGVAGWQIPERELLGIIGGYHRKEMWSESIPAMVEYLRLYLERDTQVRLKLAQILVLQEQRPAQALRVLEPLNSAFLDEKQRGLYEKVHNKALQLQRAGVVETDVAEW
jgi:membrane associated rhomboid family serine protease